MLPTHPVNSDFGHALPPYDRFFGFLAADVTGNGSPPHHPLRLGCAAYTHILPFSADRQAASFWGCHFSLPTGGDSDVSGSGWLVASSERSRTVRLCEAQSRPQEVVGGIVAICTTRSSVQWHAPEATLNSGP